jgi:hypothetical protein
MKDIAAVVPGPLKLELADAPGTPIKHASRGRYKHRAQPVKPAELIVQERFADFGREATIAQDELSSFKYISKGECMHGGGILRADGVISCSSAGAMHAEGDGICTIINAHTLEALRKAYDPASRGAEAPTNAANGTCSSAAVLGATRAFRLKSVLRPLKITVEAQRARNCTLAYRLCIHARGRCSTSECALLHPVTVE